MKKINLQKWFAKSTNANTNAKREQIKTVLVLVGIAVVGIIFYLITTAPSHHHQKNDPHFAGAFDDNVGGEYDHARIQTLLEKVDNNTGKVSALERKAAAKKHALTVAADARTQKQIEALQADVKTLREKIQHATAAPKTTSSAAAGNNTKKTSHQKGATSHTQTTPAQPLPPVLNSVGIDDQVIRYQGANSASKRTAKNYVWAGSFVNGYLLTGIIGDAGTNSTKNKGTVAIKLTGNGVMPNGQRSHLAGCVVLGSTYGDLSSDSDVIHAETLSCAGKKYSFEKKVYGSVFDLDAMQDLRGIPVLKVKPILSYAAVAGMISGIGQGVSASGTTQSVTGSGVVSTPTSVGRSMLGGGLSKPADKITDYLMSIANMYHPIVVAHAGRKVTVLFQAGFWIDKPHQAFQSMQSIDSGMQAQNGNSLKHEAQNQYQRGKQLVQTDTLTKEVAAASGHVMSVAQNQAQTDFNQHKLQLGQAFFSPAQSKETP